MRIRERIRQYHIKKAKGIKNRLSGLKDAVWEGLMKEGSNKPFEARTVLTTTQPNTVGEYVLYIETRTLHLKVTANITLKFIGWWF